MEALLQFIGYLNQYHTEGIRFEFNIKTTRELSVEECNLKGLNYGVVEVVHLTNTEKDTSMVERFFTRRMEERTQILPMNQFIDEELATLNRVPESVRHEYESQYWPIVSRFAEAKRDLSLGGTFLRSMRQIAGFYWYIENEGQNLRFQEKAAIIAQKYGFNSANSGRKAQEFFNKFLREEYRTKPSQSNLQDLQAINNEFKRLGLECQTLKANLERALSES
jgi:hypothetical protein